MIQVGWAGVDQTVEMINENVLRCSVYSLHLPVPFRLTDGRFPVGCEPRVDRLELIGGWEGYVLS